MKIAIIGTGISGLVAAYLLNRKHEITVFEANDYIGGHTNTVEVEEAGRKLMVDTGFIVFNDWTYPNFVRLLEQLGVASQPSDMSFSVKSAVNGLEYNGTSMNTLFAQRRNLLRPSFWRMIRDIMRFNKEALDLLKDPGNEIKLGDYLAQKGYSSYFVDHYLIPMGAAVWSANVATMMAFPALFFARFFKNHGFLSVNERPVWRVVKGGSKNYVEPLTRGFRDRIRLNTPVVKVVRDAEGVLVTPGSGEAERYDHVVLGVHADQALKMLADASPLERRILDAIPYQENQAVLHTDTRLLPKRKLAWAAWNYHIPKLVAERVAVTYNMNILQGLNCRETYCVTLNRDSDIDPAKVIRKIRYHHPTFTLAGIEAQKRFAEISGINRTHFCGAYWFNGFHEDGVRSGMRVAEAFGEVAL